MKSRLKQALGLAAIAAVMSAILITFNPLGGGTASVKGGEVTLPQLTKSINMFTVDALKKVGEGSEGNFVISPLNLYVALLLLYEGADSVTAQELAHALHIPPGVSVCKAYSELIGKLPVGGEGSAKLLIANGVWLKKDFPFKKGYVSEVRRCFNASVREFKDVGGLSNEINSWVTRETQGMIKELVRKLSKDTEAVLASAMFFRASWVKEFSYAGNLTFHTPVGGVKAHFMRLIADLRVVKNDTYVAVELPYRDTTVSLIVVMPKDMERFQEGLNYRDLSDLLKALSNATPKKVEILMPAFQISSKFSNMAEILKDLGINSVFSLHADLSRMAEVSEGTLRVNKVIHVAAINVTEKGTEASAATAITIVLTSIQPGSTPELVKIDKPFMYFLADTATGTVLFAGEVINPAQS